MQSEESQKEKSGAILKILVGGLLIYYAYALGLDIDGSWNTKQIVLAVFGILFTIVGISFAGTGVVGLVKLFNAEQTDPGIEEQEKTEGKDENHK